MQVKVYFTRFEKKKQTVYNVTNGMIKIPLFSQKTGTITVKQSTSIFPPKYMFILSSD